MWPSSWECLSPDTCVRCANVTDDTCLYNKFTCLCNYKDGDNATCIHQEIMNVHKSKFNANQSNINLSLPGTSGISALNLKSKRRMKRKKKEKYKIEHIKPDYLDGGITETTNLLSAENFLSPDANDVNEPEHILQSLSKDHRDSNSYDRKITDESSSDSSSISTNSSSSSSSSSSDSSFSDSSSCDSESKVTNEAYKGYQIMNVNDDCDNSDYNDESDSSSSSDSADSTSASSDNSWWQEYEQLKDVQFFKKPDSMKDSGYVSTTSPNDSNITDE